MMWPLISSFTDGETAVQTHNWVNLLLRSFYHRPWCQKDGPIPKPRVSIPPTSKLPHKSGNFTSKEQTLSFS